LQCNHVPKDNCGGSLAAAGSAVAAAAAAATAKLQQQARDAKQQLLAAYQAQAPFLGIISELQSLATVTRIRSTSNMPGVRFRYVLLLALPSIVCLWCCGSGLVSFAMLLQG
jgi:hypothetical protein